MPRRIQVASVGCNCTQWSGCKHPRARFQVDDCNREEEDIFGLDLDKGQGGARNLTPVMSPFSASSSAALPSLSSIFKILTSKSWSMP